MPGTPVDSRFDPDGEYVRRYVPELAGVEGGQAHRPWRLAQVKYLPPLDGVEQVGWI